MLQSFQLYSKELSELPEGRLLITTINAHSYNVAQQDTEFAEALRQSDVLLPDGISIVLAKRLLSGDKIKKIAGEDLFYWEMNRIEVRSKQFAVSSKQFTERIIKTENETSNFSNSSILKPETRNEKHETPNVEPETASVLFLGSSEEVLAKIKARAANDFPNVEVHTYSPPYKAEFTAEDNRAMVEVINKVNPAVLFVGMTAPKQEKWAYRLVNPQPLKGGKNGDMHLKNPPLGVRGNFHICCIGAVFDFYAETVKRAPQWIINIGLEWLYRLVSEPKRMWRRYLIGNVKFVWAIVGEKIRKV